MAKSKDELYKEEGRKNPKRVSMAEKEVMLLMSRNGKSVDQIADAIGRSKSVVIRFFHEMQSTKETAKMILEAGAAELATRIVKKATVREAMEVLSRPGIDVLAPPVAASGGDSNRLEVSVAQSSCGTVIKVGVGGNHGEGSGKQLGNGHENGGHLIGQGSTPGAAQEG